VRRRETEAGVDGARTNGARKVRRRRRRRR